MDKFNLIYKDFLNFLLKHVPAYKKNIYANMENENNFITNFIQFNLPYFEAISNRNRDIFLTKYGEVQLIKNLRFKKVLKVIKRKSDLENIWKYLHKLYIIAYNSCDLKHLVKKYPNHTELLKILENHNTYIENIMLSSPVDTKSYESSSESESSEEEDDEEKKLREEFEKTILNKKNKKVKEKKEKKELEEGEIDEDADADANTDANTDAEKTDSENNDKSENSKSPMENFDNMFDGTIIGDLAKEISEGIDPKDLEFDLGNMENPSDLFKGIATLMSNGKMQNIVGTVGKRMKEKMESGEINQAQLLQETMAAASKMNGQMGDISQLFQQMGGSGGMPDLASMMGMAQKGQKKKKRHHKRH